MYMLSLHLYNTNIHVVSVYLILYFSISPSITLEEDESFSEKQRHTPILKTSYKPFPQTISSNIIFITQEYFQLFSIPLH